jgi:hypothetical protein
MESPRPVTVVADRPFSFCLWMSIFRPDPGNAVFSREENGYEEFLSF